MKTTTIIELAALGFAIWAWTGTTQGQAFITANFTPKQTGNENYYDTTGTTATVRNTTGDIIEVHGEQYRPTTQFEVPNPAAPMTYQLTASQISYGGGDMRWHVAGEDGGWSLTGGDWGGLIANLRDYLRNIGRIGVIVMPDGSKQTIYPTGMF